MTRQISQIVPVPQISIRKRMESDDADPEQDHELAPSYPHPLLVMHGLLKGRYKITATLAAGGFIVGSLVAYFLCAPKYQSVGIISVHPAVERILYTDEQNTAMPVFDAFVDAQVNLLSSDRSIHLAMESPQWKAVGWPITPEFEAQFQKALTVDHEPHSEVIMVSFLDQRPELATAGVKAVIDSYLKLVSERDADNSAKRLEILEERRVALTNQLKNVRDAIDAIANIYGSDNVDSIYQFKQGQLNQLDAELQHAELALASMPSDAPLGQLQSGGDAPSEEALRVSLNSDPEGRQLLSQQLLAEARLDSLRSKYGEHYPLVEDAINDLAAINKVATEYAELPRTVSNGASDPAADLPAPLNHAQAERNVNNIMSLRDHARADAIAVGRTNLQLPRLKQEAEVVQQKLNETESRIEQLNIESGANGRVSVESDGDQPLIPYKDRRRPLAAVSGLTMGGLCVGMMMLIGLVDQRLRYSSNTKARIRPLTEVLGVIPDLPSQVTDAADAMIAAHSVHQIRSLLEMRSDVSRGTFAITSASAGAGKTSVAIALGLSFAASGAKTLLIDADIIGGGLSARLQRLRRRKLGEMLSRQGRVSETQVCEAMQQARSSGQRIGEVLLKNGMVSADDINRCIAAQKEAVVGLREVLSGEPLENCVAPVGPTNLFVLSLGSATTRHIGQLSSDGARALLEQAQKNYDYVLVDTGPILGSLEASMMCRHADDVVMVITPGDFRQTVDRCLRFLQRTRAHLAGVLFNRECRHEVEQSYSSSRRSSSYRPGRDVTLAETDFRISPDNTRAARIELELGPLAAAVAMHTEIESGDNYDDARS